MKTNAGSVIAQVNGSTPTKTTKVGYRTVVEKLPPAVDQRKMVCPQGNVRRISLGGKVGMGMINNPYGNMVIAELLSKGWVYYAECPIGKTIHIEGETPCKGNNPKAPGVFWTKIDKYRFEEDECCHHVEELIKQRQADKTEQQLEYAQSSANSQDRLVAVMEAHMNREAEMAIAEQGTAHAEEKKTFGTAKKK